MIRKILCWLGFHYFFYVTGIVENKNEKGTFTKYSTTKECAYCGKVKS